METTQKKAASFKGIRSAGWVIVICFIIAVLIFHFVLGNPSNFMNNDPNNHPLPGNFLGTIYKGGFIVPVIQTLLLTVIALSIERYIAIGAAFGKGSLVKFVANIKAALAEGDMKKAQQICDSQRGSVANVVNATLKKYAEMENDTELSKDQKLLAIQKELEEATADDGAESSYYWYHHDFRYIDGIARYSYRYDPFICRPCSRRFSRLHGSVARYF